MTPATNCWLPLNLNSYELDSYTEQERDRNGQTIMVESGQYRDKLINDKGTPRFVQEPVMVPKMVSLPKARVDALKLQRDQSLDKLERIVVKEVSEA